MIEPFSGDEKPMATRAASGKVIAQIASQVPLLIGGSADLTPSNNTRPEGWDDFQPGSYAGRYLRFGVREHGMSAIANGLAASGMRPYVATFFNFLDYAKPSVRLSALSRLPVIWVYTHDSVGLGEDGPTHQPIEQLATLRATPDVCVFRPADANETIAGLADRARPRPADGAHPDPPGARRPRPRALSRRRCGAAAATSSRATRIPTSS